MERWPNAENGGSWVSLKTDVLFTLSVAPIQGPCYLSIKC